MPCPVQENVEKGSRPPFSLIAGTDLTTTQVKVRPIATSWSSLVTPSAWKVVAADRNRLLFAPPRFSGNDRLLFRHIRGTPGVEGVRSEKAGAEAAKRHRRRTGSICRAAERAGAGRPRTARGTSTGRRRKRCEVVSCRHDSGTWTGRSTGRRPDLPWWSRRSERRARLDDAPGPGSGSPGPLAARAEEVCPVAGSTVVAERVTTIDVLTDRGRLCRLAPVPPGRPSSAARPTTRTPPRPLTGQASRSSATTRSTWATLPASRLSGWRPRR